MPDIILATLNARYIHSAFGLRYLYANLGPLKDCAEVMEFGIQHRPADIAEQLLARQPRVIGLGVYIWNVAEISALVAILKQVAPQIYIVLGGPEVSHPPDLPSVAEQADYIITGYGEVTLPKLCSVLLANNPPDSKVMAGETVPLSALVLPYAEYTDTDIRQRIVYVEASRGCPFKCEFCLSALDQTAKPFELQGFLHAMETLYERGARHFKFIDRTFNLKIDTSVAILEFFLAKGAEDLYLHFEVIPDNLPERLQQVIQRFPAGSLQFEIGVQSFDPKIQQLISRQQNNDKTRANLAWLRQHSNVHIHADLIAGLPGDTLQGFGASFDALVALKPQEIQVGILKRLRGAPINRHSEAYALRFDPQPPYAILSTSTMSFQQLQRITRFARFWDLIGNSGRFVISLPLILADQPFSRFLQLSDALFALTGSTWQIALKRLFELIFQVMTEHLQVPVDLAIQALEADFLRTSEKSRPDFLNRQRQLASQPALANKRQRQATVRPH